jgi:hypothetical protein
LHTTTTLAPPVAGIIKALKIFSTAGVEKDKND